MHTPFNVKSPGFLCICLFFTSRVSQPPTMLSPRPVRPLEMSIVVSHPGMMGQVAGSQTMVEGVEERLWPWKKEDWDVTLGGGWNTARGRGRMQREILTGAWLWLRRILVDDVWNALEALKHGVQGTGILAGWLKRDPNRKWSVV